MAKVAAQEWVAAHEWETRELSCSKSPHYSILNISSLVSYNVYKKRNIRISSVNILHHKKLCHLHTFFIKFYLEAVICKGITGL